jgi:hypothetical protein
MSQNGLNREESSKFASWLNSNHSEAKNQIIKDIDALVGHLNEGSARGQNVDPKRLTNELIAMEMSHLYQIIGNFDILKGDEMKPGNALKKEVIGLLFKVFTFMVKYEDKNHEQALSELKELLDSAYEEFIEIKNRTSEQVGESDETSTTLSGSSDETNQDA